MTLVRRAPMLRQPLLLVVVIAAGFLVAQRASPWSDDLSSLSPVSRSDQILDQQLRQDIGAPDVRYLVVIHAKDEEAALQASEGVADSLQQAMRRSGLEGFDSPAFYLPSRRVQRARQAALPASEPLRASMRQALQGLPFRPNLFEPFFGDVAAAGKMPLLDRHSLQGTQLELKLDSLLVKRENGWVAMLPLQGVINAEMIEREIGNLPGAEVVLLDLKRESEQLFRSYRREVLTYSLLGAAAIVVLLSASLRSARRVFDVLVPLAAAVVVTSALLVWISDKLSIFHLVGLLLVVAVGSNYSLFFDRQALSGQDRQRTIVSLLFASVSTMIGFGLLSFSKVPILNALGSTVGMGAIMALIFSAILIRREEDPGGGRS